MTYEEELEMLNRENEMSVEELRAMYAGINIPSLTSNPDGDGDGENSNGKDLQTNKSQGGQSVSEIIDNYINSSSDEVVSASDDEGEFMVTGPPEVDDETTMEAEERLGRDMTYEEELEMLNRESQMSVEELRAMYAGMNDTNEDENGDLDESQPESSSEMEAEADSNTAAKAVSDEGEKKRKREESVNNDSLTDEGRGTKRSREGTASESENDGTAAMKALEASAMEARETLATRPFLLAPWVKLRKYQQIGLNWLVSLQSRRLNGILADGTYAKRMKQVMGILFPVRVS
jgi:SNF2 family DNA or RNA helicase